jgi:hypothetical protein
VDQFCSVILTICINEGIGCPDAIEGGSLMLHLAVVNGYGIHKQELTKPELIAAMKV